jgi:hypothetical protein
MNGIAIDDCLFHGGFVRSTLVGILAILTAAALFACGGSTTPTSPNGTVVVTGDIVRGTGTVQFLSVEGGFFAIRGDDGVTYDPTNLPSGFQRAGLRVRFEARIRHDLGGIHMVGPIVDVISITAN